MNEFINANGGEFTLSDVITYETGSSMEGTVFEGNTNGFAWEAVFGDTAMSVTFTVPEPAEISALLGVFVLAMAIMLRRKNSLSILYIRRPARGAARFFFTKNI